MKDGTTSLEDVPIPRPVSGQLLISTDTTLVSAGTERMLVKFGKSGWISKARQQPDKVKMVLGKARSDGVAATYDAVKSKLDQPLALGYCNVGRVAEIGSGVEGYELGDRIVSNGKHAEFVTVPRNLCAKIPASVSAEEASFTVLGAIGLQGIRLANPTLGECIVVTGLGVIGLMVVQMLRAQGCRVLGIDFDESRLSLARQFGAKTVNPGAGEDVLEAAAAFSRGNGVDAVIITAASDSDEPMRQAAHMSRKRGRIVLVGVVGLNLMREDFYEKELTFQVSCSYGPGRYDPKYEEGGQDYPLAFVRWTEQRNFEAVLDLMASGLLDVKPLITHRFDIEQAAQAMDLLTSGEPSMGILINYPDTVDAGRLAKERKVALGTANSKPSAGNVAFLGAGNYAGRVLIPAFAAAGAQLTTVVSSGGISAVHSGKKHGFVNASTDAADVFEDENVDTVVIATRHDAHADQILEVLKAGKHVFCEKPLCLTVEELKEIEAAKADRPDQQLMIGFNRRFAPHVVQMKELLEKVDQPKAFVMTVNAGEIPPEHWTQDPVVGGGRIVGEGCHFIDLLRHLAGAPIVSHHAIALGDHPAIAVRDDKATITLSFEDGSIGTIHYFANGHSGVPKERLEVFAAGRVLQLDNFLRLKAHGWPGTKGSRLWKQDKGQTDCAAAFMEAVRGTSGPAIPVDEVFEVSRVSIEVADALKK
ncbi:MULTISPECIES: bi-domain-containing oxidoreductase [unclassified Erythrobacter]|uniref:bi-domain-containing oxidoreductase n=1 Tax=unclassified Erythrobacter TaxID=2633097 RepID=UPI0018DD4279|nr:MULTISPECIES: bi-domain-containing oxidoreductase [unclassified Erythrobacter]MBO6768977.1 bi-domain-containing oxidoreductase [Erythrobacter sp.]